MITFFKVFLTDFWLILRRCILWEKFPCYNSVVFFFVSLPLLCFGLFLDYSKKVINSSKRRSTTDDGGMAAHLHSECSPGSLRPWLILTHLETHLPSPCTSCAIATYICFCSHSLFHALLAPGCRELLAASGETTRPALGSSLFANPGTS